MSTEVYAVLDLTKKVRFQTGEKEDRNADACNNIDSVTIYDNCWTEGSTPPKSQDNTTEDRQQATSVSVSSGKTLLRASAAFLGLLCFLLLAAVIVLVVLSIQDKSNWNLERNRLWVDNANLTSERNELQTNYSETKTLNCNLTQRMRSLENDNDLLKDKSNNLKSENQELQEQIKATSCPASWIKFGNSCYLFSTSKRNWYVSSRICENQGAHLVVISNWNEQKLISLFNRHTWIGLSYEKTEGHWKWVNGMKPTTGYWERGQPNSRAENCVKILPQNNSFKNWNAVKCNEFLYFSCEKVLQ